MATEVKIRRGTTAENNAFTGVEGELTYDTQSNHIITHDGVTLGGFRAVKVPGDTMTGTLNIVPPADVVGLKIVGLGAPAVSNLFEAYKVGETSGLTIDHNSTVMQTMYFDNAVSAPRHDYRRRGSTGNENAAVITDTPLAELRMLGWDGAAFGLSARIIVRAAENFTVAGHGSNMVFSTTQIGTVGVTVENIRLTTLATGTLMSFGGVTSAFPALKRSGAQLTARLADDSGDAMLQASRLLLTSTVNTESLTITGYSLTGANINAMVDLSGTWNTTGSAFGLKFNITNTASSSASKLFDFQVDGISRINCDRRASFVLFRQFDDVTGCRLFMQKRGTTGDATGALSSGSGIANTRIEGWDGTTMFSAAGINTLTTEAWTATAHGCQMNFEVTPIGSSGRAVYMMLTSETLALATGHSLALTSGTNQRAGNAVLVGGTVTVVNATVTANTVVMLTRKTSGGTIGTAITYTVIAATSFTITSDSVLDTSTFSYMLIEVP